MSQGIWGIPSHYQYLFAQIIYGEWLWICLWDLYYSLFDMHKNILLQKQNTTLFPERVISQPYVHNV